MRHLPVTGPVRCFPLLPWPCAPACSGKGWCPRPACSRPLMGTNAVSSGIRTTAPCRRAADRPKSMVAVGHRQVPDVLAGITEGAVPAAPVVHVVQRTAPAARPLPGKAQAVAFVIGAQVQAGEFGARDVGVGAQ